MADHASDSRKDKSKTDTSRADPAARFSSPKMFVSVEPTVVPFESDEEDSLNSGLLPVAFSTLDPRSGPPAIQAMAQSSMTLSPSPEYPPGLPLLERVDDDADDFDGLGEEIDEVVFRPPFARQPVTNSNSFNSLHALHQADMFVALEDSPHHRWLGLGSDLTSPLSGHHYSSTTEYSPAALSFYHSPLPAHSATDDDSPPPGFGFSWQDRQPPKGSQPPPGFRPKEDSIEDTLDADQADQIISLLGL